MLTIYAQAAPDARPRPSDVILNGVRLQFIGTRATKVRAEFMTQRESRRANGLAACYQDGSVDGKRVMRFVAAYDRGARRYGKPIEAEQPREWLCLYCKDVLVEGASCQKPACTAAHAKARRRMGVHVDV
jgi:hypothetical protein